MRLKLRWEVEDERLLWFGSSLALVWSSNDRFIRNMEFIPLKKMDAKGRFNFHKGGAISQLRGIFAAEGHFCSPFRRGGCAPKWHSCAKGVFHNCETPCEMGLWLRKLEFLRFGDFAAISQLRNEGKRL